MSEIFSHNIVDIVSGISPLGGLGGKKVTFSLFIGLYVKKELSVDKAFVNGEMIYRLEFEYPDRGKNAVLASALGPDHSYSMYKLHQPQYCQCNKKG